MRCAHQSTAQACPSVGESAFSITICRKIMYKMSFCMAELGGRTISLVAQLKFNESVIVIALPFLYNVIVSDSISYDS